MVAVSERVSGANRTSAARSTARRKRSGDSASSGRAVASTINGTTAK